MTKAPTPVSLDAAFAAVTFLPDRTPMTTDAECFGTIAHYRDGAVYIAHYAGRSEWERHSVGDEVVLVLEGATTLVLLVDGDEVAHPLGAHELLVVPKGTWHRFETPDGVNVMTVTPQPTDHQVERPT